MSNWPIWSWSTNTLTTWCEDLTLWKRPWCWERLKAGGEGDDRGWDDWMASPTWWTWVWASSRSWWWTEKPGMLQSMGSQRVGHDQVAELNWPILGFLFSYKFLKKLIPGLLRLASQLALVVKNPPAKAGDAGSIHRSRRSSGNSLQYSCMENPMDTRFWQVFLMAQLVKNLPATWETWVRSLGWEDLLQKEVF